LSLISFILPYVSKKITGSSKQNKPGSCPACLF
jgi:hypothetical protein